MSAVRTILAILIALAGMAACGGAALEYTDDVVTQAPPYVHRIDPAAGPAGTVLSIYGFGFSVVAPNNIVVIGATAVAAEGYELLAASSDSEIERITATVPADAPAGDATVFVMVRDHVSNADTLFTVQ